MDILGAVRNIGDARMKLRIAQTNGVESRIIAIGPIPRVNPGKVGVQSDIRMTQLSAEAIDSIEDDDVADAITPYAVTFAGQAETCWTY